MSALRGRCPSCRTMTAVAIDDGYECHACGRLFVGGLVRVPAAWGAGGDAMADAAGLPLDLPETAVVREATLEAQNATLARSLPALPVVLGGCCCAHVGAIRGLAARHDRLAVIWLDAHGDLNTPDTSPSGNAWGMPLRMAIDEGSVASERVAHLGARSLDEAEVAYMAHTGIDDDLDRVLAGASAVYIALDCDVLAPGQIACFMPEPGGPSVEDVERRLALLAPHAVPVAGLGLTGLQPAADPAVLGRLVAAAGLGS